MARTDISVCSRALVGLGALPINSFQDATDTAKICATIYPELKEGIISKYPWRSFMTKKELSRDNSGPIGEWQYSFIIPGEAIGLAHAVFTSTAGKIGTGRFEVFGRRVYSDMPRLWMDFLTLKPEAEWQAYFAELVAAALCSEIAFAVTDQQSTADAWTYKAYGTPSEGGMGGLMGQATILDAQGSGNIGLQNGAFIDARFGSVYPGDTF